MQILLIGISFIAISQNKCRIVFFDSCSEETLDLEYQLWYYDSTIKVNQGESVLLNQDWYLLSVEFRSHDSDWISTFNFDIYPEKINTIDTLYLSKLRQKWNGLLHPQEVNFYFCESPCSGEIKEIDANGTLRAHGKFKDGSPIKNIKYFDKKGKLKEKWIYRNGNLITIKKTKVD